MEIRSNEEERSEGHWDVIMLYDSMSTSKIADTSYKSLFPNR